VLTLALLAILYAFLDLQDRRWRCHDRAYSHRQAVRQVGAERAAHERIRMGSSWDRYVVRIDPEGGLSIQSKWQYRIVPSAKALPRRLWRWRPKDRKQKILLLMAAAALALATYWTLGLPLPLIGIAKTWSSAVPSNWSTDLSWGGTKPAAGDSVTFDATGVGSCTVDEATAALIGFTVTTGYTGTITVNNAIDTDDLDVDFGGAGTWAGTAAIVLTPGGAQTITSDQAIPALTLTPTAAATITLGGAITVTGALVINTNATLDTSAASNFALTVSGATTITGTLLCNGSTASFGSGITASFGISMQSGGVFTGGSGPHTIGSIRRSPGATAHTITLSSGTTTINSASSNVAIFTNSATVWSHSSGTVNFTRAGTQVLSDTENTARTLFYNFTVNGAGNVTQFGDAAGFALTIANNFTITAGTFDTADITSGTDRNLTVTGTTIVQGTLDCNGSTISLNSAGTPATFGLDVNGGTFTGGSGPHTIGSLDIRGAAAYTATSGTTTINGRQSGGTYFRWSASGAPTFTHNSGTFNFTYTAAGATSELYAAITFFNWTCAHSAVTHTLYTTTSAKTMTIAGALTVTSGTLDCVSGAQPVVNLSVTGASSITGTLTLDNSAPTFTGNVAINSGGIIQKNSGTGVVNTNGNWTVAAGGTLSLTGAGQVFNQNTAAKQIDINGTCTLNGASGNNVVINIQYAFLLQTGCTIDFQYVTFDGSAGATTDFAFQSNAASLTITRIDNITCQARPAIDRAGLYVAAAGLLTITNSTFDGGTEATYIGKDILIGTNRTLQLSGCTYSSVGMVTTGGWISSIADQGVANAHVFYGILSASSPTAAYQVADADNVTLKQADAYEASFNSVLTIDQAETFAAGTVSASTTLRVNGNVTLTFTSIANSGVIDFAANTVNAAVLSGGTVTVTAPDMDSGGAGSKVTLTGVTITPALTTGGTGVTITYTGTCVQTGAMVVSTGDKITTATATITFSGTFTCTGEVESTGASGITFKNTYTANAGTEDYQAGTVTIDLGTTAYTVTSGTRKFFNLTLTGANALTLGANNIGCVGTSFVASAYTGTIGSGANNYRFDLYLTSTSQTATFGAQTWNNATAGNYAIAILSSTASATCTLTWGGATITRGILITPNANSWTVNPTGTLTGTGDIFQISPQAGVTGMVYNHNASIVTGFGTTVLNAATGTTASTFNITTGTFSGTTMTINDLMTVNVTGAATMAWTTITLGEAGGDGATLSITAAPASLTVGTLALNALSAATFDATFTLAPTTAISVAATATLTVSASRTLTLTFGAGFTFTSSGTVTVNGKILMIGQAPAAVALDATSGLGEANPDRAQIAVTGTFAAGDIVKVYESSGDAAHLAGESRSVESIAANDYLDLASNLSLTYLVANGGKVIRTSERSLRMNSSSAQNGTIGGTGTWECTGPRGEVWASTLAVDASLAFINCDVFVSAAAGGTVYEVRKGYLNKWLHPIINKELN